MADSNKFCGERIAHHAGAENPDFHSFDLAICLLFLI
jgi:hypothetical protein